MLTKEEILKKLQQYAKEGGGETPSEKKFYEYAEIGIYDLKKHGWAKYGDLVDEGGLTPNKFDNTKYSHEQLCEIFIEVIREKSKWPTRGILDVKHHKDSRFPDSSTFYKKLGLTVNLAKTILEFIKDKQGYADVVNICNSVVERFENISETEEQITGKVTHGWVYLFKHGHYNQYRIGQTSDLLRRGSEIRIQLPERATLVHSIETVDPVGVETYWLNRFKSKQMNGDWFNLSRTDVNEFKHWKKII